METFKRTRVPCSIKFDKMISTQNGTATGAMTGSLCDHELNLSIRTGPYLPNDGIWMVRCSHPSEMVCQLTNGTHRNMRSPLSDSLCSLLYDLEQVRGTVCGAERESRERKRCYASIDTMGTHFP